MTTEEKLINIIHASIHVDKVKIDNYHINYIKAGKGSPLLLLHGGNVGWGQWFGNIAQLSKNHTVYALDYPGAGRSSRLDYKNLDVNRDLYEVVKKFVVLKKLHNFSVIGSSIGGWITLKLAMDESVKVNKAVVTNSLGFTDYVRFSDRIISFYPLAQLLSKTVLNPIRSNKNVEKFLRDVFYNKDLNLPIEFINYFYETMEASHNLLFISKLSSFWGMRKEFQLVNDLHRIKSKCLIIWGANDVMMPLEKNIKSFSLIKDVTVKIFEKTGHMPSVEKNDDFNSRVLDFLK